MEIPSYKAVFDVERRIYRIDTLRLNPAGVPLRGIAYFAAVLTTMLLAGHVPVVGVAVRAVPWYLRGLIAPGVIAGAASTVQLDGRRLHRAAPALLRAVIAGLRPQPSHRGGRWRPADLIVLADGGELRRLRYHGPGAVRVEVEHVLHAPARLTAPMSAPLLPGLPIGRRCRLTLSPAAVSPNVGPAGRTVVLARGTRLEVTS